MGMKGILRVVPKEEYLLPGNPSCPGCPASLGLRYLLKALGGKAILVIPASCTSIIVGPYPFSSLRVPVLNIAFAAAASTAAGISEALKVKGKEGIQVVVWAGDGGTADIGLQALSGAAERNSDILYVCYDNEAYMNTGIQRSSLTPYGAWTTTTPKGKVEEKKNLPMIVAEHKVPYVATASVGYPIDLILKVRKAIKYRGFKYIHLHAPCPYGWRFPANKTVEVAKLAVKTGIWVLYEIENGKFRLTSLSSSLIDPSKRLPVNKYLKLQGRFKHLSEEDISRIQEHVNTMWDELMRLVKES